MPEKKLYNQTKTTHLSTGTLKASLRKYCVFGSTLQIVQCSHFCIPGLCFDFAVQRVLSSKSFIMSLVIITLSLPQSNTHQNHSNDPNMQTWGLSFIYIVEARQEINLFFFTRILKFVSYFKLYKIWSVSLRVRLGAGGGGRGTTSFYITLDKDKTYIFPQKNPTPFTSGSVNLRWISEVPERIFSTFSVQSIFVWLILVQLEMTIY